jgi:hypothetical protein
MSTLLLAAVLVTAQPDAETPYPFLGGRTVTVPIQIHGQIPDGLTIRSALVQLTSHLAIPAMADQFQTVRAGEREFDIAVALPAVKRESDFELRFESRHGTDGDWQPAGRIGMRVYPAGLLDPLRIWSETHTLRVDDDEGVLTGMMRRHGIRLAGAPGPAGVTLYAGSRVVAKQQRAAFRQGETAVLFTEREGEVPYVLVERAGTGTIVRVEMKLAGRLAADDPAALKTLLGLIQILNEQDRIKKE